MKKLLIVDDEPDITRSLKKGLEFNGFSVDVFNDPLDAVSNYKVNTYDLMIIDIRMPKINGFEFYREIKRKDDKIKACFLTAFEVYHEEFKKIFPNMDVQCFIRKPITINELVAHINSELGKS